MCNKLVLFTRLISLRLFLSGWPAVTLCSIHRHFFLLNSATFCDPFIDLICPGPLTLRLLMSHIYIYGAGELPTAAHLLRSWVRIPPGAWIFVCCECRVLSGRGLRDELITRPEESYRLWCVVVYDLETSRMGAPYIHDISNLRVNDLTLILLTWRKWWVPNNASK
jgi:hypothetical protein